LTESPRYRALIVALLLAFAACFSLVALASDEAKAMATEGSTALAAESAAPAQEQEDGQQPEQATSEEDSERAAWAATAVALFLAITGVGFLLAVYGYSSSR